MLGSRALGYTPGDVLRRCCIVSLLLFGCAEELPTTGLGCNPSCAADFACVDQACVPKTIDGGVNADAAVTPPPDAGPRTMIGVRVEPENARLVSADGAQPEQVFDVIALFDDGSTGATRQREMSLEPTSIGRLGAVNGRFVANGIIGGSATVRAQAPGPGGVMFEATATLTVVLERTIFDQSAPRTAPTRFAPPLLSDPARAAGVLYPLDGAVMPQNVFPARVQWSLGAERDLFRIQLTKPNIVLTAYVANLGTDFENAWQVDTEAWRALAQTDPGRPAIVTVDRWEAATGDAIADARPVSLRFASAALTGSVYYWDIAAGRIRRIDDGTGTAVSFMPNPPVARGGSRCVGCHAVSTSGRYMAGRLGGGENIGAVFDLTVDLSGDPPPTTFALDVGEPSSIRWWFASWNPDDTRMVVSTDEGATRTMKLYDPLAGVELPVMGTLPSNATHPAWSPDGDRIAYVANVDGWGGDFSTGDVAILPVTGLDAVGMPQVIHSGMSLQQSMPAGAADSYPTWTPDGERIAFAHGDGCRSENDHAALYIMRDDGSDVVRLNRANGGGNTGTDFQPRFSPFDAGGYFWLSFLSRRDYGNARAGTRGTGRQQIWVTAIRKDPNPGEDPSEVGYWLPGQDTGSRNISAYWAPRACRPDGDECSVGSECCGGDCRPNETGTLVCSPPPPERCRQLNQTCTQDADCCVPLECSGNVCIPPPL